MIKRFSIFTAFLCIPTIAHAHLGHIGEVAGHGHLVAIGAIVAAGVIAGLVAKVGKSDPASANQHDDSEEEMPEDTISGDAATQVK